MCGVEFKASLGALYIPEESEVRKRLVKNDSYTPEHSGLVIPRTCLGELTVVRARKHWTTCI